MRAFRKCIWLLLLSLTATTVGMQNAQAQDTDPPPPSTCLPTDPDYDPRLCVPIDGGLAFLLAAGVGYGIFKNRTSNRKEPHMAPDTSGN